MFVDIAKIHLKAGNGGNGAVSFHREKYVAAGGPDGGDGGKGGDIVFKADSNLSTLADFRYKRKYVAPSGDNGGTSRCTGKSAPNLVISVPVGTEILGRMFNVLGQPIDGKEEVKVIDTPQNYGLEVEQLGRCILEGESPYVSNEFTLKNARVLDRILKEIKY